MFHYTPELWAVSTPNILPCTISKVHLENPYALIGWSHFFLSGMRWLARMFNTDLYGKSICVCRRFAHDNLLFPKQSVYTWASANNNNVTITVYSDLNLTLLGPISWLGTARARLRHMHSVYRSRKKKTNIPALLFKRGKPSPLERFPKHDLPDPPAVIHLFAVFSCINIKLLTHSPAHLSAYECRLLLLLQFDPKFALYNVRPF